MSTGSLSPVENPDTEAGPDIADLGQFQVSSDSFPDILINLREG